MTDQPIRLKRRWLYIPFAIAGVIVFAYYLLWRAGAAEMKSAVSTWADDRRAEGFIVSFDTLKSDGFPFFLRVHLNNPEIISPDELRWRGERLSLDALPYDLNKLIFSLKGEQIVAAPEYGEWRGKAEDLRASIRKDAARGWTFSMNIGDANADRDDGAALSLKNLVFDLAPEEEDPTTLTLTLDAVQAEASIKDEVYTLDRVQTVTSLTQSHLLSSTDQGAQWRASGGAIIITGLFASADETQMRASGTISLDANHHPAGIITTDIENPAGFARILGKTGVLTHNEAEAAAAGLTLMAFASGGKITAPIELTNGKAEIAGIKIADLPKIE